MISAARAEKSMVSSSTPPTTAESSRDSGRMPMDESEAYHALLARAGRKTGSVPAPLLVRHVLSVTREADWPVQREALEALLRRLSFRRRDELVIASRPPNRAIFGLYGTRRSGSSARPYRTVLESADPLRGSCDCPDFLRSSLGLCKHLLAILEDIGEKPRQLEKALRESGPNDRPRLTWDPVRPLRGDGDLLAQVRWAGGQRLSDGDGDARLVRRWFRREGSDDLRLKENALTDPGKRLSAVEEILEIAKRRGRGPSSEPALVRLLSVEKSRLERAAAQKTDGRAIRSALRTLRRRLYPYQREGVERFLARGRLLLADDMGLGKTAQAIAACHVLWHLGKVRRGLLVTPASLKAQWEREWQVFSDAPIALLDGGPDDRHTMYRSHRRGFLVASYEQVIRDLEMIHRWKPDIIVLDEAQRIKNWATKTAACVKTLAPPYRLVLTGTPMENRIDELASILDWVDDFALEPKWRLIPWHTTFVDGRQEVAGARNLDTLRARLSGCMVRRVRREVLDQLPPRTDVRVPVQLTGGQSEAHDSLAPSIAVLLGRAKKRPLTQAEFLKLMQLLTMQRIISNGLAQVNFEEIWPEIADKRPTEARLKSLESPKLIELRELIGRVAVDQERKIVIFSQWRRMLKLADWAISDILADAGVRSVFFTGHEAPKRRTQNVVEFHDDPATRIFFASDAGGIGLNLQRASNCCINLELPWNPAVLEQRIGRIYRLGQKRPIDAFHMVCETGIESRINDLVGSKQAFFESLFDGKSDAVAFENAVSFMSRIEKIVEAPVVPSFIVEESPDATAQEREIEAMLAAADESRDAEAAAPSEGNGAAPVAAAPPDRAPESGESPRSVVGDLFSQLRIEQREDGGIRIDAPPEAASALGSLFEGMARIMREAAGKS